MNLDKLISIYRFRPSWQQASRIHHWGMRNRAHLLSPLEQGTKSSWTMSRASVEYLNGPEDSGASLFEILTILGSRVSDCRKSVL